MSGFFGIVRTDGAPVSQELLDRVCQTLEFRGPDGANTWQQQSTGFCYTFLDTQTPRQAPVLPVGLDNRYWLIGEVRLDAREELIASLCDAGTRAGQESTDADLVLRAWRAWGESALGKILGDFSIGLWDAQQKTLCCARDFAGARPFYYAQGPGVLCFSNMLQALLRVPGISRELDDLFLCDFLLAGESKSADRTVWQSARRLPPGHRLLLSKGQASVQRFLQLPVEEPLEWKRPEQYLECFQELLGRGVADRLPKGKSSLYLSGGLDSAAVCATAARLAARDDALARLKAFTVSWQPLMNDPEPEFAALTAGHLGLAHEILRDDNILPDDETQPHLTPEPGAELFFGRARRLYRAISAHSRVVLSGDGGDNVLDGQAWPYLEYLRNRGEWRGIAKSFGEYFGRHGKFPALRGGFRGRLLNWFQPKKRAQGLPAWLNDDFARRIRLSQQEFSSPAASLPEHPLHPYAYRGLHSGYWGGVLEEEDAGWTGVNLESRAPLLDLRLLKFLLRLPPVPWCMHKELTRRAMREQLPVEVLKRRKTPLRQDPLEACQERSGWRPQIPKNLPKRMGEFVKWNSWLATLESTKGLLSWEVLYPLALSYWLKAIENGEWIQ